MEFILLIVVSSQVKQCMVDSHLGETGVRVIVITVLEQERETELDHVLAQHLHVMEGEHIHLCKLKISRSSTVC